MDTPRRANLPRRRTAVSLAAALIGILAFLLIGATPSHAHDQLLASSPSANEELTTAPTEVTLEFTDEVLSMGAVVVVVDSAGAAWAEGDPALDGAVVTQDLAPGMPAGNYEVRWQVVSGDGHPISDAIPFSVGDATEMPRPSPLPAQVDANTPASTDRAATAVTDSPLRLVTIGIVGAAAGLGILGAAILLVTRRRGRRTP